MAITTTNTCCSGTTGPLFPSNITITDNSTTLTVADTTGAFRLEDFSSIVDSKVTLANVPIINSIVVDKNGQILPYLADWTINGSVITFLADVIDADDDISVRYVTSDTVAAANAVAVGTVSGWAGNQAVAPDGWEICNGRNLARVGTYAALFAAIGTTYGAGDGATTFTIPNTHVSLFDPATGTSTDKIGIIKY